MNCKEMIKFYESREDLMLSRKSYMNWIIEKADTLENALKESNSDNELIDTHIERCEGGKSFVRRAIKEFDFYLNEYYKTKNIIKEILTTRIKSDLELLDIYQGTFTDHYAFLNSETVLFNLASVDSSLIDIANEYNIKLDKKQ